MHSQDWFTRHPQKGKERSVQANVPLGRCIRVQVTLGRTFSSDFPFVPTFFCSETNDSCFIKLHEFYKKWLWQTYFRPPITIPNAWSMFSGVSGPQLALRAPQTSRSWIIHTRACIYSVFTMELIFLDG